MKESYMQISPEERVESKEEIKEVEFRIKEMGIPDWELNDETVESAAKNFLKKEEINITSWKKLGVDIKNGVRWWGVEVNYSEK